MNNKISLSVVIITRDEETKIQKCIESVLRETANLSSYEIILVDSASKDKTVELAKQYSIRIFQLKPEYFLSPAAGRYVGTKIARRGYVLFIDGDMVLKTGWLELALPLITREEKMAGICGRVNDIYFNKGMVVKEVKDRTKVGSLAGIASSFGGTGLYRRSVLNDVGGFNPYLMDKEESEMAMRIVHKGYYLWKIPVDMADHLTHDRGSFFEVKRLVRLRQHAGIGQVFRIAYENKTFWVCFRQNLYVFHFFAFILFFISFVLMSIFFNKIFLFLWFPIIIFYLCLLAIRKKSICEALVSVTIKILSGVTFFRDFVKKPKNPASYPLDLIEIK